MDIGASRVSFNCPECEFINTVSLDDVANQRSIICVGCLKTIELQDGDGSAKRATSEINEAFRDLGDSLSGH